MLEDFKDKIRQHNSEKAEPQSFPPEVIAKLQSEGLDPETVTMKQLFPETLDEEQGTIRCKAEKHGKPRQFKISPRLIAMLMKLPKINEYIFARSNLGAHRWRYDQQKTKLAEKLQNPRLKQIHFHTLRHFFATKLFDQTKSLPLVQEKLGHRNINSTMVYTHLVEFDEESQNYYHAVARDEKEAGDLIDRNFAYVCTTPQGIMMFRKRK